MKLPKKYIKNSLFVLTPLFLFSCAETGMNKTAGSAIAGTALGAGTGAIIGSTTGNAGRGVAIGAALGGITGALLGNEMDSQDKQRDEYNERQRRQQEELDRQRREIEELKRQQSGDGYYRKPSSSNDDSYYRTPSSGGANVSTEQQKYDDVYRKY